MSHECQIPILYEDNHLLIVDKPHGLLTQPTREVADSVEERLKVWIKVRDHKPGAVFLHAVHRLDKPAGGIVMLAKTSKALARMQAAFREKRVVKIYEADVPAGVLPGHGRLEHYLVHLDYRAEVDATHPEAKHSILEYQKIDSSKTMDRLRIELKTGRYHQIRAQLAHLNAPIAGDEKYGSCLPFKGGIALRQVSLSFDHPTLGHRLEIQAPGLPPLKASCHH